MDIATEGTLTAAVLAETTDTTIDTVERLAAVGILHRTADGRFVEGDRHRLRLVAAFEASGVPLEVLIAAAQAGRIRFDAYDELHADLGPTSGRTYGAFREAVDPDATRLAALFTALGLAEPSHGARLPVEDERLLQTYLELSDETGDPALASRVVRLHGEAARRTSAATLQAYAEAVRALGSDLAEIEESDYFALLAKWTRFAQGLPTLAGWLAARHMSDAIDAFSVELVEQVLALAGYLQVREAALPGIAFVDLTGFTGLTQRLGDDVAAGMSLRLADLARDTTSRHGGRLVKVLGDGALLAAPTADDAAAAALELLAALGAADLPSGHAGVHSGPVVEREGDVFGRTVNIAARLADAAPDRRVYAVAQVASTLDAKRFRVEVVGSTDLQGVGPVDVWSVAAR
ncbi:MAG: adenylate/guanylate cyclase domain-containing protein [Chloroflexota bacterium]